METAAEILTAAPPQPDLRAELEASIVDAMRRASSRVEHVRLIRIQSLVHALNGAPTA